MSFWNSIKTEVKQRSAAAQIRHKKSTAAYLQEKEKVDIANARKRAHTPSFMESFGKVSGSKRKSKSSSGFHFPSGDDINKFI